METELKQATRTARYRKRERLDRPAFPGVYHQCLEANQAKSTNLMAKLSRSATISTAGYVSPGARAWASRRHGMVWCPKGTDAHLQAARLL